MAITKIKVENLTVFEDMEMNIDANVNVIIGENGTGKTQLLKFTHELLAYKNLYETIKLPNGALTQRIMESEGLYLPLSGAKRNSKKEMMIQICLNHVSDLTLQIKKDKITLNKNALDFTPPENILYIPTKDMLTHSKGLLSMKEKYGKNMPFDKFQIGIVSKALQWNLAEMPAFAKNMIVELEKIMDGVVVIENEEFFILKTNGQMIPFEMEAEGIKKFGLIWQLLMNENIIKGSILLWDEPEANINPKLIPVLAEIILELGRNGVQIFLATHDYFLPKYIEVLAKEQDKVEFHALSKTDNGVKCYTAEKFSLLDNNAIIDEKIKLYREEIKKGLD